MIKRYDPRLEILRARTRSRPLRKKLDTCGRTLALIVSELTRGYTLSVLATTGLDPHRIFNIG